MEQEPQKVRLELEPLEKAPERTYSNYVLVNSTQWDFTLHFGHVVLPTAKPKLDEETGEVITEAKCVARVTVPVSLVKGIIQALQTQISQYESLYGPLPAAGGEIK